MMDKLGEHLIYKLVTNILNIDVLPSPTHRMALASLRHRPPFHFNLYMELIRIKKQNYDFIISSNLL
jgi:hypothetical protein